MTSLSVRVSALFSLGLLVALGACGGTGSSDPSGGQSAAAGSSGSAGSAASGGSSGTAGSAGISGGAGSAGSLGGSAGGGGTAGNGCLTDSYKGDAVPAVLMFQLDTSGSMNCDANDTSCLAGDPTADPNDSRWDVFRNTLIQALGTLPDTDSAGVMHYPGGADSACAPADALVDIGLLSTTRSQITSQLQSLTPAMVTPTHDAVLNALAVLKASTASGNKFLVLATDGKATVCKGCDAGCSNGQLDADSNELVNDVAAAKAEGLPTFVIGVRGSESYRNILSRLASAAGTQTSPGCNDNGPNYCHFDLTDPSLDFGQSLSDALAAISGQVLSCEFSIPPSDGTFDPTLVNVQLTSSGMSTSILQDPSRTNGWNYSADGTKIVLYGSACESAKNAQSGSIDIVYGCPTQTIQ